MYDIARWEAAGTHIPTDAGAVFVLDVPPIVDRGRDPILVLHGERDRLIPFEHARRLAAANPRAQLHGFPCGHNDCDRRWPLIQEFLVKAIP